MNGAFCEYLATLYLRLHRYKILDRNYHSRFGEIDIIAEKNYTIVFIEVKARGNNSLYQPAYAVNLSKQRKIIKTSQYYILNKCKDDFDCRFDVIEITRNGMFIKFNHIINAFEA